MKDSLMLLFTSFADEKSAAEVVRSLVQEKLAACGTLLPQATSIYSWEEKVEETSEVFVVIKTSHHLTQKCMDRLKELHPYDVPEVIAIESAAVGNSYLEWLQEYLK